MHMKYDFIRNQEREVVLITQRMSSNNSNNSPSFVSVEQVI